MQSIVTDFSDKLVSVINKKIEHISQSLHSGLEGREYLMNCGRVQMAKDLKLEIEKLRQEWKEDDDVE